jgi:endoglucanase
MGPIIHTPLHTHGRNIIDVHGNRVKLSSINWYGSSDILFIPSGLDIRHRSSIAQIIHSMGFNSVRLPYSDEMVISNPLIPDQLLAENKDLIGMRALDVFEAVVRALTDAGVAVIVNNHITRAAWCDGKNLCDSSWKNDFLGPICRIRQTEEDWIRHWEIVMAPLVDNPLVIGADLRNEPRGVWGTMSWDSWAGAAERGGERLLKMQSNWLIFVEGVSSANDLSGVRERPVRLSVQDRVVYSAHVYSWSGWGSGVPFSKRSYESFTNEMGKNWGFLLEGDIAPVWVGEFGAPIKPGKGEMHYWENLVRLLKANDADFGYWAINPRKPEKKEKESYAICEDDWKTPVEDYRLQDLRLLMN